MKRVILHFGIWKMELEVQVDQELVKDTLVLPKKIFGELTIPDELTYEIKLDGRNIFLGPVIAFVPVLGVERLNEETLVRYKDYMQGYSQINGLVYICAAKKIDFDRKSIEGYYYSPENGEWKKGIFPFPHSLYRKTGYSQSINDGLTSVLGDKVFNTYFFNKWELWDVLSTFPELRSYLPETASLSNANQIYEMIEEFGMVYLKQAAGQKAQGIIRVHKSEQGYHFVYRLKGEKILQDREEIEGFIKELNRKQDYLIQQAIPVKQHESRNFDFRVILQKDGSGEWVCPGIIGRFGKKGSIATNFLLDGFSLSGLESLKVAFKLSEREAFAKEQEIIRVCKEACSKLNVTIGHYADLGIDVMVDENMKIWILEINKLHDHKFPLYGLNDPQMYYKVVSNPFLYAKFLGGF